MPADPAAFAGGLGHDDWPCLRAGHSLRSRLPAVDFSPWLADRLYAGDRDAILMLFRELGQAGYELDGLPAPRPTGPVTRADWDSDTGRQVAAVLDVPLDGALSGLDGPAEVDLRVALLTGRYSGGGHNGKVVLGRADDASPYLAYPQLAAVMAAHDIRLADPVAIAERATAVLQAARRQDVTPAPQRSDRQVIRAEELSPPPLGPDDEDCRRLLAAVTPNGRCQLADYTMAAPAWLQSVWPAARLQPYFRTKELGRHAGRAVEEFLRLEVLEEVADPERVRDARTHAVTRAHLADAVADAGGHVPTSATKRQLATRLEGLDPHALAQLAPGGPMVAFSSRGRRLLAWLADRAAMTTWLWRAWQAAELILVLPRPFDGWSQMEPLVRAARRARR